MSVLQDWAENLPLKQQTVLLTALRGPDFSPKETCVKQYVREIRRAVLKSAGGTSSFMTPQPLSNMDEFLAEAEGLSVHWFTHFMHAAEVIGYKHPDNLVSRVWLLVYDRCVKALHLFAETERFMDERLTT